MKAEDTLFITVRDSIAGNYSPYRADQMPDARQVRKFGPAGTFTGPQDDVDGDGLDNALKAGDNLPSRRWTFAGKALFPGTLPVSCHARPQNPSHSL